MEQLVDLRTGEGHVVEKGGVVAGADEGLAKVGDETVCRTTVVRVEDLGRGELAGKAELGVVRSALAPGVLQAALDGGSPAIQAPNDCTEE